MLHLELRIGVAKRLKISKVRLDMIDMETAEFLDSLLRRNVHV